MENRFTDAAGMLLDEMQSWYEGLITMLPNLAIALVVAVAGWFVAKGLGRLADRGLKRVLRHREIAGLLALVVRVGVLAGAIFVALGVLELDKTVTSLLAGVGILGFALSFAFRDMAANFMSGVVMAVRRPFEVDDVVETNGVFGVVQNVSLREVLIRQFDGREVMIPNRLVFEDPIINYTRTPERRVDVEVGVAYGDDLDAALEAVSGALQDVKHRRTEKPVQVLLTGFGGSSIDMVGRFWISNSKADNFTFLEARSDAIRRVKRALDDAGLTIPFPIRTLDFGVVGGERLDEVLPSRFYAGADGRPSGDEARSGADGANGSNGHGSWSERDDDDDRRRIGPPPLTH